MRLKVSCASSPFFPLSIFQFLLVRLKEYHDFNIHIIIKISIPTGAIKRLLVLFGGTPIFLFQFLLVRLKVYGYVISSQHNQISIPTGAIKRTYSPARTSERATISIPTGAIKSSLSRIHRPDLVDFNSYWCD